MWYCVVVLCREIGLRYNTQKLETIILYLSINISTSMQASTQLQPQPSISMGPQRKVFDTIYGFISFPKLVWEFIDTPHVQRLRNIKQLGCLFWVFPGAMHSRF